MKLFSFELSLFYIVIIGDKSKEKLIQSNSFNTVSFDLYVDQIGKRIKIKGKNQSSQTICVIHFLSKFPRKPRINKCFGKGKNQKTEKGKN